MDSGHLYKERPLVKIDFCKAPAIMHCYQIRGMIGKLLLETRTPIVYNNGAFQLIYLCAKSKRSHMLHPLIL